MRLKKTLFLLIFVLLSACQTAGELNKTSLYDELGGEQGINSIVTNLVNNIGQDELIFYLFADANVTRFREHLAMHLCDLSDGPCRYSGDSMETIHDGMQISEKEFNHLVDLLIDAMYKSGVSHTTQNKLLARLAPLRGQIIYR